MEYNSTIKCSAIGAATSARTGIRRTTPQRSFFCRSSQSGTLILVFKRLSTTFSINTLTDAIETIISTRQSNYFAAFLEELNQPKVSGGWEEYTPNIVGTNDAQQLKNINASVLIKVLQTAINQYGDLPVCFDATNQKITPVNTIIRTEVNNTDIFLIK